MRYIITGALALTSLLWGCAGIKGLDFSTSAVHVAEERQPDNYTLIYSIPKTTLTVSVEATQTIIYRGPYYQYAERFLGISDVPAQDVTSWKINNVEIDSYSEADPDHYYSLVTNDRHVTNFFRLGKEGFVLPINHRQLPELKSNMHIEEKEVKRPLYTDMSIQPKVVEETRTVMRMVRQDTAFVNVPVMQRETVTKSLQEKAAEVADLIFELRGNRFKLLSGDLDLFPDGKAMESIIAEFERLEKEYLTLFTGKVFEARHNFVFEYTPGKEESMDNGTEHETLFRFSDSEGVLPATDVSGRPIIIELVKEMKTSQLDRISQVPSSPDTVPNRLFYRIPDVASVRLTDENRTISSNRLIVSQYGKIVSLPPDFLWEK